MSGWVGRTAGPLSVAGMEACWLAGGLWLVEQRVALGVPPWWVLAGLPAAFAVWRLSRPLGRRWRAGVGVGAGLVWTVAMVLLAGVPGLEPIGHARMAAAIAALGVLKGGPTPSQLAAAAAAAAWVCGLRTAAKPIDLERVLGEFQLGLMLFFIVLFCAAQWDLALTLISPTLVLFFLFFLGGAAITQGLGRGGWLHSGFRGPWVAVVAGHAVLVLGAGAALAAAVTPEALALVLAGVKAVWDAVTGLIAALIAFLVRFLPQPDMGAHPPLGGGAGAAPETGSVPDLLRIPDLIRSIAQFLVGAFWVGLFALSLWRIAGEVAAWLRRQAAGTDGAEIEVIPGALRQDLLRALRWLRVRLSRWWGRLRGALGAPPVAGPSPPEIAAVRRTYRQLLRWAAAGDGRTKPRASSLPGSAPGGPRQARISSASPGLMNACATATKPRRPKPSRGLRCAWRMWENRGCGRPVRIEKRRADEGRVGRDGGRHPGGGGRVSAQFGAGGDRAA